MTDPPDSTRTLSIWKIKHWSELVFTAVVVASLSYITRHQQYWLPGWRLAPLPVILLRDQLLSCPYLNITAVHYGLPSHSCWYLFYEHWWDQQCSGLSIPGFAGLSDKFVFYNSCVLGVTRGLNMDVTSFLCRATWPLFILYSICAMVLLCSIVTGVDMKLYMLCLFCVMFSSNSMENWGGTHTQTFPRVGLL